MGSLTISLRQHWKFFRLYFKARKMVGAFIPSSRALARATLDAARVDTAPVIIEFGPGTGVFTKEILKRMRPDARLLVFEIMPEFIEILREQFDDPRIEIIPHSAVELPAELDKRGIDKVESIVCGLPFNSFPPALTRQILEPARDRLTDNGVLACIQQTPFQLKLLRSIFPRVRVVRYILLNVPPSFVFACDKG